MILYVNGCSWSSLSTDDMTGKVYGDFLSKKLDCPVINESIPGSCNERIFRSSIRSLQNFVSSSNEEIVCVINITQIFRSEVWIGEESVRGAINKIENQLTPFEKQISLRYLAVNDGEYRSFTYNQYADRTQPISQIPGFKEFEKRTLLFDHYEKQYYDLFYNLITFTSYCKLHNIKYLIFAGMDLIDINQLDKTLPWISVFYSEIQKDPAIIDFEKINFCYWAYKNGYKNFENTIDPHCPWGGHPNEQAHEAWAEYLYNKLKELYNI